MPPLCSRRRFREEGKKRNDGTLQKRKGGELDLFPSSAVPKKEGRRETGRSSLREKKKKRRKERIGDITLTDPCSTRSRRGRQKEKKGS